MLFKAPHPTSIRLFLAVSSISLALFTLGCHSGTPAAPEGSKLSIRFEYVEGTRDLATGDFEAIVSVRALDQISDVPQVGVGVFFEVESGPGSFAVTGPVTTDGGGNAQNVLIASGAVRDNDVTVSAFSGDNLSDSLSLNVEQGRSSSDFLPDACFTWSTDMLELEVDVSCSSDLDCPTDDPDEWAIDWGDGSAEQTFPFSQTTATHTYASGGSYDVSIEVTDCQDLRDSDAQAVSL